MARRVRDRARDGESIRRRKSNESFIIAKDVYGEAAAGVDTQNPTVAARP